MGKIVTSYGINKMTGKVGDAVFSIEEGGVGMRSYNALSKQPFTPAQLAIEAAFTKANQTWPTIGFEAAEAWRAWGRKQKVRNELTGKYRDREGKDCFVGCYAKILQLGSTTAIPNPPFGTYSGDSPVLSALLNPSGLDVESSSANKAGTTTELMIQELPSAVALPTPDGYRTVGFVAFEAGSLSTTVDLAPGFYLFAYQFVEIASGRVAGFKVVRRATVGLSVVQGGTVEAPVGAKKAA